MIINYSISNVMTISLSIIAAISIVLVLLLGTNGNLFGNSNIKQEAYAQMLPDNTYIPSNGILTVPPEILTIP